ncbi:MULTISPECIES: hypothetical protein [Nocardia]|uniref:hypothetical protein n=1 Tax=Nocardia TaxID=1817 RepID=UPI002457D800|nr:MULTISPECIES: hypothetical protein [Nocardia]
MSRVECPSWCVEDREPEAPEESHGHIAEATYVPREGYKPVAIDLYRDDLPDFRATYVRVDFGDGGHEMSVADAMTLGFRLVLTAVRGILG